MISVYVRKSTLQSLEASKMNIRFLREPKKNENRHEFSTYDQQPGHINSMSSFIQNIWSILKKNIRKIFNTQNDIF